MDIEEGCGSVVFVFAGMSLMVFLAFMLGLSWGSEHEHKQWQAWAISIGVAHHDAKTGEFVRDEPNAEKDGE